MKPVDQTLFGEAEGNYQAACLASILELPLDRVPNFCGDPPRTHAWQKAQNEWLAFYGLVILTVELRDDGQLPSMNFLVDGVICIVSGKSPRGDFDHAVVGRYRLSTNRHWLEYIHDPHPSRHFLPKPRSVGFFVSIEACRPEEER